MIHFNVNFRLIFLESFKVRKPASYKLTFCERWIGGNILWKIGIHQKSSDNWDGILSHKLNGD